MKKTSLNAAVDAVAFAGFLFLTSTGVILHFLLPPKSGEWRVLWGLNRHEWGAIHFYISLVLLAVLALHIALHWKWILSVVKGRAKEHSGARLLLGLFAFICLIAIAFSPLASEVEIERENAKKRQGRMLR